MPFRSAPFRACRSGGAVPDGAVPEQCGSRQCDSRKRRSGRCRSGRCRSGQCRSRQHRPRGCRSRECGSRACRPRQCRSRADRRQWRERRHDGDSVLRRPAGGRSMTTLAETYDALLLDLDGTVYLGGQPIDHVAPALARAKQQGARSVFVTNNASRPPAEVAACADRRWASPPSRTDVLTSPQAAAVMLADRHPAGTKVLVIGAPWLEESVRQAGLEPVRLADGQPGRRRPGTFAGHRLAEPGRGVHRAAGRRRLGRLQRRHHSADRPRHVARQRLDGGRPGRRHRPAPAGGRQARTPAAGCRRPPGRQQSPAGRRRPAGHRHRLRGRARPRRA